MNQTCNEFLIDRLYSIQKEFPILTFQNVGYEYLNVNKFNDKEKEAFKEVTYILSYLIPYFVKFNNFKITKHNIINIRFQGYYGITISFIGVYYIAIEDLKEITIKN